MTLRAIKAQPILDRYYLEFDVDAHIRRDPLQFPHQYDEAPDIEVAGFIAASLAFGRVAAFRPIVSHILQALGPHPAATLDALYTGPTEAREAADDTVREAGSRRYRWLEPADIESLLRAVASARHEHGSLEAAFLAVDDPADSDTWSTLGRFLADLKARAATTHPDPDGRSRALGFLFPSTSGGAACKRQHLFLRWMVRDDDRGADLGVWSGVDASRLVMPCDTHTARIGHALGLCASPKPGRRTAEELSAAMRLMNPADPVRYDFSLCHLGISGGCRARFIPTICDGCGLKQACRWWDHV